MAELEQFCILAKAQKGRACAALIEQVLSNRKIFVFGELLALPSVTTLDETEHDRSLKTLELFAYGKWSEYRNARNGGEQKYIDLNEAQTMKLKQLSIIALAEQSRIISYDTLLKELDIESVRALEDLIIETIYAGLVTGKIDHRGGMLRVQSMIGRDPRPCQLQEIVSKMTHWSGRCTSLLAVLEKSSTLIREERDAGRVEQEGAQKTANEVKAFLQESSANGDRDRDDDDDFPQRGQGVGGSSFGSGNNNRSAKRTRGITGIGGGSFGPNSQGMSFSLSARNSDG